MTLWLLVPLLALAAIAQTTLLPLVSVAGLKIDLALMLVVTWGLLGPFGEAAQWGFVAGIFLDLLSGLPFGTQTIALMVVGLMVGLGQASLFRGNLLAPPVAMMISTVVYDILILGVLSILDWNIDISAYLLHVILPAAVLNTVVLPLVYLPLQWLHSRARPRMQV